MRFACSSVLSTMCFAIDSAIGDRQMFPKNELLTINVYQDKQIKLKPFQDDFYKDEFVRVL